MYILYLNTFLCICRLEATLSLFNDFLHFLFLLVWEMTWIYGFALTLDGSHGYTSISGERVLLVTVKGHTRKTVWEITWSTGPLREQSSLPMVVEGLTTQRRAPNKNSEVAQRLAWVHHSRVICQQQRPHTYCDFRVTQVCSGDICDLRAGPDNLAHQRPFFFFTPDNWRVSEFHVSKLH